jgi:hypothetical protein
MAANPLSCRKAGLFPLVECPPLHQHLLNTTVRLSLARLPNCYAAVGVVRKPTSFEPRASQLHLETQ